MFFIISVVINMENNYRMAAILIFKPNNILIEIWLLVDSYHCARWAG